MPRDIRPPDARLGWSAEPLGHWRALGSPQPAGRVSRLDRGWSTILTSLDGEPLRVRNIGADVAVGDFVVVSEDGERVDTVLERHSAFVRRASFEGQRAVAHTLAANIDVVMLVHALTSPPNQRRLERELVLAWDSGARPVVVLTKTDLVEDATAAVAALADVAPGVDVLTASGITGEGVPALGAFAAGNATIALLGASGVGKSTLVNALVPEAAAATREISSSLDSGKHTTTYARLYPLAGGGELIDSPGLQVFGLAHIAPERLLACFRELAPLAGQCRFRDCRHDLEPGCALREAATAGRIHPRRWTHFNLFRDEIEAQRRDGRGW